MWLPVQESSVFGEPPAKKATSKHLNIPLLQFEIPRFSCVSSSIAGVLYCFHSSLCLNVYIEVLRIYCFVPVVLRALLGCDER